MGGMIHDYEFMNYDYSDKQPLTSWNLEPHIWAHFFKRSSACSTKVAGVGPDFSVVILCYIFTPK